MNKKILLVIALIIISILESYSQIVFEKGYFIDESNQKTECLIKNIDWFNNPSEFEYKLSENDPIQKVTIETVKEFSIDNASKYVRAKINIDRSSNETRKISSERNPVFKEEILFLKLLIEGKASLFHYVDGNLTRFFYALNDSLIDQLVYKTYMVDDKLLTNNTFKQQLFMQLKCEGLDLSDINRLRYNKRDLERFFIKYNECVNSDYTNYDTKQKRDVFNLSFRPGLNYSSLQIHNNMSDSRDFDFGSKIGFRMGIEAEFILPYNKNKWSLIVEPTFQYFNTSQSKETSNVSGAVLVSEVEYKSIEVPAGVRYYMFLNDNSKLFINVSYIWDFPLNSTIEMLRQDNSLLSSLEIESGPNIAMGGGYKFKDKFSIELRYHTSRNILNDYVSWGSDYNSTSIVLGYSLF
ncbi:hypothetical protein [Carboxylicivirga sp. RSCT41]|uniref:hypothetical protein n=1 Tax=Carboxylicivirga agarovorans TaxID=3417570 RepID=UPI003D342250